MPINSSQELTFHLNNSGVIEDFLESNRLLRELQKRQPIVTHLFPASLLHDVKNYAKLSTCAKRVKCL